MEEDEHYTMFDSSFIGTCVDFVHFFFHVFISWQPATSSSKRASASEGTPQNKRLASLGAGSQAYPVHSPSVFSPST